jgi:hypothetical protein
LYYIQPRTIGREKLQARQTDINTRIEDLKYWWPLNVLTCRSLVTNHFQVYCLCCLHYRSQCRVWATTH